MLSQVEQAKARGGIVVAVATDGDTVIKDKADHVLYIPRVVVVVESDSGGAAVANAGISHRGVERV